MAHICGIMAETISLSEKKLVKEDIGSPPTKENQIREGPSCAAKSCWFPVIPTTFPLVTAISK